MMNEEIKRLMSIYAIGELEAIMIYRREPTQSIYAMVPTGNLTKLGLYYEGFHVRYNEWRQMKFVLNLN